MILSKGYAELENLILPITDFLKNGLKLEVHPDKIFLKTLVSGIDFLGWVNFPGRRVLRTVTKRRMLKKIASNPVPIASSSYVGLLKHGNAQKLTQIISQHNPVRDIANGYK